MGVSVWPPPLTFVRLLLEVPIQGWTSVTWIALPCPPPRPTA